MAEDQEFIERFLLHYWSFQLSEAVGDRPTDYAAQLEINTRRQHATWEEGYIF